MAQQDKPKSDALQEKGAAQDVEPGLDTVQVEDTTDKLICSLAGAGTSEVYADELGKLFRAIPVPILLVDEALHVVFLNEAGKMIGKSYESIKGRPFSDLIPNASAGREVEALMKDVFVSARPRVIKAVMAAGRRAIWARMHIQGFALGAAKFLIVLLDDVTSEKRKLLFTQRRRDELEQEVDFRKRAEQAIRSSEEKYRSLLANAPVGIMTVDREGRIIDVNPKLLEVLGSPSEESTKEINMLTFPLLVEAGISEIFRRSMEEGATLTLETPYTSKWGKSCYLHALVTPMRTPTGEVAGCQAVVEDITDRKKAEEALRESEEKYRLVVQNANEAILVAQDGKIKFINDKGMEIMGYTREEMGARPFLEFIHADDREMVAERHRKRMRGEPVPHVYPFRIVDKWGYVKWMEINAVLITWEGRSATLNFLQDITARRRLEEELGRVEKLESLGILAGGIAHDFNNILTAIMGNITLARMVASNPEKMSSRLVDAEKACARAQSLTQQLLTFSRGGAPIKKIMHLGNLVKDSCAFALRGSNVSCELSREEDLSLVEADEGQLSQVINNLLINATQAMPEGGVVVVRCENVVISSDQAIPLKDGNYVKLTIKDHGVGIPAHILPRVFDPYFTTKREGSGLGLATAFSIIKNHEGLVTVESEVGQGTTFQVYLPATEHDVLADKGRQKEAFRGSGRVLIMDDEESIRELARTALTELGYTVEAARDGEEAISLFRSARESHRPFDATILDLTVPGGMGGKEAVQKIRDIDPQAVVIVSSGYSMDPVMGNFRKYGFDGVVAKPYTLTELSFTLDQLISQRRG
ncbi:MAG: PAS domain S-box protein [Thermodesulfobacteriota bacterium]